MMNGGGLPNKDKGSREDTRSYLIELIRHSADTEAVST